jgi:hypothetical protein
MTFFYIGQVVESVNRDHLRGDPNGQWGEYVDVRVRERYTHDADPLLSVIDLDYGEEFDILSSDLDAARR